MSEVALGAREPSTEAGATEPVPLEAKGLEKSFTGGDGRELEILRGVSFRVHPGEAVAIVGESGAGKSTLLHLLGALERPNRGSVLVEGVPLDGMEDDEVAGVRNRRIGFVFQFHHLLREFTALENAMMPCLIAGVPDRDARERATEVLEAVGLAERLEHRPWELSGGEQQRVAVARALANRPAVLLADEPSGNLDEHTSDRLHDLLFRLRSDRGLSMVLVTHDRGLAGRADRVLRLSDGVLRSTDPHEV